jgi:hypothetical protein
MTDAFRGSASEAGLTADARRIAEKGYLRRPLQLQDITCILRATTSDVTSATASALADEDTAMGLGTIRLQKDGIWNRY